MKYLITGGAGFIGSHLAVSLIKAGHCVRILDNFTSGAPEYKPKGVELIAGNVTDAQTVQQAINGMDGCFHLAAVSSAERCSMDPLGSHTTNIIGTITVFDAARRGHPNGPVPVVFASSAAVYGNNTDALLREDSQTQPISIYATDKLICELYGAGIGHIQGIPNCGLRFFNVYGPKQNPYSPCTGIIRVLGQRLREGYPITINGDGYHRLDFIYISDVVDALTAAMVYCCGNISDIFNICTGVETTIISLAEKLGRLFNKESAIQYAPSRSDDPRALVGDPTKARDILGFRAAIDLATGLKKTFGACK